MIRDYEIKRKLGVGTYGVVYMVSKKSPTSNNNDSNSNLFVIKQIPLFGLTPQEIKEVKTEANILSQIKSIYVVKFFDSFEENNILNIVMEYCDGGDLEQLIENKKKFPLEEDLIWKIFIQITIGLTAIHNLKILHRDLKTSNIFLTKDLNVKIGDMGVAKKLSRGSFAKTIIGTPYYLSPEICEEKPYNEKSDIWALGCILYELCTFNHPFEAKSQGALILKILNGTPAPIKQCYSENMKKIINLILEKNIYKRPSCKTILKLPYVKEKVKKLGMIEQYQSIGLKIMNQSYNFKKISNKKKEKININDDINNKNNRKKVNVFLISNDNTKNNSYMINKTGNPWTNHDYNNCKKNIKKSAINKISKKIENNFIKKISNNNIKKRNNIKSKDRIKNKEDNTKLNLSHNEIIKRKKDKSPNFNFKEKAIKKNKIKDNFNNKEIKNASKDKYSSNKKKKEINVKVDLTNTLELNQIINNYLDKDNNLRESKTLDNIKEFANNLNIFFSNNLNTNKINQEKENSPVLLKNKDNNIEQEETNDTNIQESTNLSNKKQHENILNFDVGRLASIKMGITSYDELLEDFAASRGPTIIKNSNNPNIINKSISPFENQTIRDINSNTYNKDSLFQVVDIKNNNNINLFNKDNNMCESDEEKNIKNLDENESSEKESDSGEENVRIIMDNGDEKKSIKNKKDEKDIIFEDKTLLMERLENIKKEMLELIGEEDYKYVMELYSFIDKSKIDEIYGKIEEYAQKYDENKKDKFDMLYFKLISTDYQIQQKNSQLQQLFFNEF